MEAVNQGKNVHQHLDLIAGLPFEDYESFQKSFDQVYYMEPEQLQLGFLKGAERFLYGRNEAEIRSAQPEQAAV